MPIPESQLETWTNRGAVQTAESTKDAIYTALKDVGSPIKDRVTSQDVEIYLQGSYRNYTNIRGDSDVDVVVQLNSPFYYDDSALSDTQKGFFHGAFPSSSPYTWENFRSDVLSALKAYFGALSITEGDKALKVAQQSGRLPADVVVCLELRKYEYFYTLGSNKYAEGIKFFTRREPRTIINFPKEHYKNGVAKNDKTRTNEKFKPTVRMFKNARNRLVDTGKLGKDIAPSYFVECLIYNAPDDAFSGSWQSIYVSVLNELATVVCDDKRYSTMVCQNQQMPLFGSTPEQWDRVKAVAFLAKLLEMWNSW